MGTGEKWVTSTEALMEAIKSESIERVVVTGRLSDVPSVRLSPGQTLCGAAEDSRIAFMVGCDGVELSSDNKIHNLHLNVSPEKRAIFNDPAMPSSGRMEVYDVTTTGCVQILGRGNVRSGHVDVNGLDISAADTRAETDRPHCYGVYVLPGAFTLWNMQPDQEVAITAEIVGVSAGRDGSPVRGSGIFISGASDIGGRLVVRPARGVVERRRSPTR
jgi:hypothetical protein